MRKYNEQITDQSIWLTATPTVLSLGMPFFVTEAGHFFAEKDYAVQRDEHDSFLLLYTLNGCGMVQSGDTVLQLPEGCAVFVDCHGFHEYHSVSDNWEFLWVHVKGSSAEIFFRTLYPNDTFAVGIKETEVLQQYIILLMQRMQEHDIVSCTAISAGVHEILNLLIVNSLAQEKEKKNRQQSEAAEHVIDYIREHYAESITVDDMLEHVPVSKYHFIRSFKRIMGITPYHYLTNHRITIAKTLLRSTDKPVAEIAENCGFADTSNFITQFRKYTGQNPLQYRKYFSG